MNHLAFAALVLLALTGPVASQPLEGNWNSFNRAELRSLIREQGQGSPGYDPAHPPYAVFDWDNTSVFLDVEEATLAYQLDFVAFKATPAQLEEALRANLPADPEVKDLLDDIVESYAWLYLRRRAGGGREAGRGTPHHLAFRAKYLRLYHLLDSKHGSPVAYPWLPQRFTGMSAEEVRALARQAVEWQLSQPIETVEWSSPSALLGQAGQVTSSWRNGLRVLPEMRDLYDALRQAGFDVWICTASFEESIREISSASDFGYANPPERVIGLRLERDADGRYLPRPLAGAEMTWGPGKFEAIRRRLQSRYGRGPALVAGDSNGDVDMLMGFGDTRIALIVDTGQSADSKIGKLVSQGRLLRGRRGARILVQERDESTGTLVP